MKKLIIAVGTFFVALIIGLTIAPFFIDINKHVKPILVKALEENLSAKVTLGEISLSLYGNVNVKIDSLKIVKDQIAVDINDLELVMRYSVLKQNPADWAKNLKMKLFADEISVNNRQLLIRTFKSDFVKHDNNIKLKNTTYNMLDGQGTSYLEMDLSSGMKAQFEFEIKNGQWPVEKLKEQLAKKASKIPQAGKLISDIDLDNEFQSLKGKILIQNGITNIQEMSMNVPKSKAEAYGSGVINAKNAVLVNGNLIFPLDNVPADLRNSDGRGKIPFEVIGNLENPRVNWEKLVELIVHAYSKDEGKKIIKKEVNKLKEKLMKDEKIKEFIKGIKF